jgi:hypothetical protein
MTATRRAGSFSPKTSRLRLSSYGDVFSVEGSLYEEKQADPIVVCYLTSGDDFPEALKRPFKRYFFGGTAACVKCSRPMEELKVQGLPAFKYMEELKHEIFPGFRYLGSRASAFIVCRCGRAVLALAEPGRHRCYCQSRPLPTRRSKP